MVRLFAPAAALLLASLPALAASPSASGPPSGEALFAVPPAAPGDWARYEVRTERLTDAFVAPFDPAWLRVRWDGPVLAPDPSFNNHWSLPLWQVVGRGDDTDARVSVYALEGPAALSALYSAWNSTEIPDTDAAFMSFFGEGGPCGLSAAGRILTPGGSMWLGGGCGFGGLAGGGMFTTRLGEDGLLHAIADADARIRVALDPGSPFPASMTVALDGSVYQYGKQARLYHLVRVAQGLHPVPDWSLLPPAPAGEGPVRVTARPAWGMPDDGADHPFPLSKAWEALLAEVGPRPLSLFLRTHPDAYVALATSGVTVTHTGAVERMWRLYVTDGRDVMGKTVVLQPVVKGDRILIRDDLDTWPIPRFARWLPPSAVPDAVPHAADLLDRFEGLPGMPPRTQANAYGFRLYCLETCDKPVFEYWAGSRTVRKGDVAGTGVVEANQSESFQLHVDAAGRGRYWSQWVDLHSTPFEALPASGPRAPEPAPAVAAAFGPGPAASGRDLLIPAVGIGAAAIVAGLVWKLSPAIAALFSRTEPHRVLDNPRRRAVHDLVEAQPGLHGNAIARRLGLGHGQMLHHLRKLEAAGLVARHRAGRYTVYFARRVAPAAAASAAVAASPGSRELLRALARGPAATAVQLAQRAGLAPATVSYHLRRLRSAGLVEGGRLALTPQGSALAQA